MTTKHWKTLVIILFSDYVFFFKKTVQVKHTVSFLLTFSEHVYCTETRPYNQGARLTAYELVHEKITSTLICDSAVAALMRSRTISAVLVGADRVAANGDTANKIGTYQVNILNKFDGILYLFSLKK